MYLICVFLDTRSCGFEAEQQGKSYATKILIESNKKIEKPGSSNSDALYCNNYCWDLLLAPCDRTALHCKKAWHKAKTNSYGILNRSSSE